MNNNFLPIGSVVLLKDAKKRVMITGYCMEHNDGEKTNKYDYCGCLFPEGIVDTEQVALFNNNQIDQVFFLGLQDVESMSFINKLRDFMNDNQQNN